MSVSTACLHFCHQGFNPQAHPQCKNSPVRNRQLLLLFSLHRPLLNGFHKCTQISLETVLSSGNIKMCLLNSDQVTPYFHILLSLSIHCMGSNFSCRSQAVVDLGEPSPSLIFRLTYKWGPKGWKTFLTAYPLSQGLDGCPRPPYTVPQCVDRPLGPEQKLTEIASTAHIFVKQTRRIQLYMFFKACT